MKRCNRSGYYKRKHIIPGSKLLLPFDPLEVNSFEEQDPSDYEEITYIRCLGKSFIKTHPYIISQEYIINSIQFFVYSDNSISVNSVERRKKALLLNDTLVKITKEEYIAGLKNILRFSNLVEEKLVTGLLEDEEM